MAHVAGSSFKPWRWLSAVTEVLPTHLSQEDLWKTRAAFRNCFRQLVGIKEKITHRTKLTIHPRCLYSNFMSFLLRETPIDSSVQAPWKSKWINSFHGEIFPNSSVQLCWMFVDRWSFFFSMLPSPHWFLNIKLPNRIVVEFRARSFRQTFTWPEVSFNDVQWRNHVL